ncbi:MAG: methyltransferase domain-containing protein [Armatimonadota bacterium]|nr:methyltransferase domain-containing protein [Armatimonadota bacterium]MDR7401892.1 methyltransferase domain-containing protein [Armatimonadota bacterium]MDR7404527.1 methyltransferase domain-containing protein [Armatimonadota bacterium]MDR7438141.1 methyltransferase domain-containing protein [Armatimonadota bacterium]MDR7471557.1 methyltransferase domain-containing protein [Armatimonadota bacterium]
MRAPPYRTTQEFLDTPGQDPRELAGLLAAVRRTNRWYGGYRLVLGFLREVLPVLPRRPVRILDVATASGDVPRAIALWARRQRVAVSIAALDASAAILDHARRILRDAPEVVVIQADARAMPFADRSVDVVLCGLALHHFSFDDAVAVLRDIRRVTAGAYLVHDVLRCWGAYAGAWLDTHLVGRNRLARHDGPLSVLRSFTLDEFHQLARAAGLDGVQLRTSPLFRVALVGRPEVAP